MFLAAFFFFLRLCNIYFTLQLVCFLNLANIEQIFPSILLADLYVYRNELTTYTYFNLYCKMYFLIMNSYPKQEA
jgi:hypothetical protein